MLSFLLRTRKVFHELIKGVYIHYLFTWYWKMISEYPKLENKINRYN